LRYGSVEESEREERSPAAERWRRLPPRVMPEEWTDTVAATQPHEEPIVLGDGVAYRGGVPLSEA
jgi:hypothetical protein